MITVVCVLRTGGDFGLDDVVALASGVRRHMPHNQQYKFLCLTDDVVGATQHDAKRLVIEVDSLKHAWPGWWSKLEAFRIENDVVLYFDLDTCIVGSLVPLIDAANNYSVLMMIRDFYRPAWLQSGVMAWRGTMRRVYENFLAGLVSHGRFTTDAHNTALTVSGKRYRGDGEWIRDNLAGETVALQDVVSGIYSYKTDVVVNNGLPCDAMIVCFHGKPRPRDLQPQPEWMTFSQNSEVFA